MEQKNKIFSKSSFSPPLLDDYPRFVLGGLVRSLVAIPAIRPEHIVALGFMAKLFAILSIFKDQLVLSAAFLLIGIMLDYVDGMLARATNRVSKFGGLLDLSSDFTSHILLFFAIAYHTGEYPYAVVSFVAITLLIEIWSLIRASATARLRSEKFSYNSYLYEPLTESRSLIAEWLNRYYMLTWGMFLRNAQLIYSENKRLRKLRALNLFSIGSIGVNQFLLCICLLANVLEVYIYFNIALFPVYIILLHLLSGDVSEKSHPPR